MVEVDPGGVMEGIAVDGFPMSLKFEYFFNQVEGMQLEIDVGLQFYLLLIGLFDLG